MPLNVRVVRGIVVSAAAAGGLLGGAALGAEALHRRASRSGQATVHDHGGPHVVLVLGYGARNPERLHPLQRWRTDIAVRSTGFAPEPVFVFTGAARRGGRSEAEIMAEYAVAQLGVRPEQVVLETKARTTWQNLTNSLPLLEGAGAITIASDPLHAARARRYLSGIRPDLAQRLVPADDYRPGESRWLKLSTAVYESQLRVLDSVSRVARQ